MVGRQSFNSLAARQNRALVLSDLHLLSFTLSICKQIASVQWEAVPNLNSLMALFVDQSIWCFFRFRCFMKALNLLSTVCATKFLSTQHGIILSLLILLFELQLMSKSLSNLPNPNFANLFASSFSQMPEWALTFFNTSAMFFFFSSSMIFVINVLLLMLNSFC